MRHGSFWGVLIVDMSSAAGSEAGFWDGMSWAFVCSGWHDGTMYNSSLPPSPTLRVRGLVELPDSDMRGIGGGPYDGLQVGEERWKDLRKEGFRGVWKYFTITPLTRSASLGVLCPGSCGPGLANAADS